jgi:Glyoxalase/Bleomycin resistance protein/Dioxygenase superfamily
MAPDDLNMAAFCQLDAAEFILQIRKSDSRSASEGAQSSKGERVMKAPLPGPIRQIGYVVRDLESALADWLALGVGPWFVVREHTQKVVYRGEPCEVTISIAMANSGDLQIELIHQHGNRPSIYTEFLDSGREGFHQFAWWTTDFDAAVASAEAAGWPVVWSGGASATTSFAYVEAPAGGPATVFEIMELTDATSGMGVFMRDAALDWDGGDPIRDVGV